MASSDLFAAEVQGGRANHRPYTGSSSCWRCSRCIWPAPYTSSKRL